MKTLKKHPRVLLISTFLVVCLSLYGQEIKEYRGVMKMDENIPTLQGHSGEGYYQYYLSPEGKRIKHGKYEFKSREGTIYGQFADGKKTGKWAGEMKFKIGGGNLSTTNSFVQTYKEDRLHGPCQYRTKYSGDVLIVDCVYDNNHLSGDISFSFPGTRTVKGQFDEDGLADGIWTDAVTPYITYCEYSHGFRKKAYRYDDSTGETEQLANTACKKVEDLFSYSDRAVVFAFGKFLSNVDGCFISYGGRNWKSTTPNEIVTDDAGIPIEDAIALNCVAVDPKFQEGGLNSFGKWVNDNLVYPQSAKANGVQGQVTLEFVVHSNGKLADVRVRRGVEPELDKEAVRVVSNSPLWTPGYNSDGEPVAVRLSHMVVFQLR